MTGSFQTTAVRRGHKWWQRLAHWWLGITGSKSWTYQANPWQSSEHLRRGHYASWLILILLIGDGLAGLTAINDVHSLISVLSIGLSILVAIWLNRAGYVTAVGWLLTATLIGAFLFSITPEGETVPQGALDKDALPIFDLLVVPLIISMSLLRPRMGYWVAVANCVLITLDFILQPHTPNLDQEILSYGSILVGTAVFLVRPIILQLVVVVAVNLLVRGILRARIEALQAQQDAAFREYLAAIQAQQLLAAEDFIQTIRIAMQTKRVIQASGEDPFAGIAAVFNSLLKEHVDSKLEHADLGQEE